MAIRALKGVRIPLGGAPKLFSAPLPIPPIAQEQSNWCWAACVEMVVTHLGGAVHQDELAAWLHGRFASCPAQTPPPFNCRCDVADVASVFAHRHVMAERVRDGSSGRVVSFETLTAEIDARRPVQIGCSAGGTGHAVLVIGTMVTSSGDPAMTVNNPSCGEQVPMLYEFALQGIWGQWTDTWVAIQRVP